MMRIRFTRAGYALAAGVAVTAMLGMSAASAGATVVRPDATTACGAACTDVNFLNPGPNYILGVHSGFAIKNNLVRLVTASNGAPKEDLTKITLGTVAPLYCTATGQAQTGSVFTPNQCALLDNAGLLGATTYQLAYNPDNGGSENLCVGAWANEAPANGWKTRLAECGVAADTVIIQTATLPGGTTAAATDYWLINGASDNFSNPLVATSNGIAEQSQPTWSTVNLNGGHAVDTQEVNFTPGPA